MIRILSAYELRFTCGCESISRPQEHAFPSVDIVVRLWAFTVPTTAAQYIGCYKIYDKIFVKQSYISVKEMNHFAQATQKEAVLKLKSNISYAIQPA